MRHGPRFCRIGLAACATLSSLVMASSMNTVAALQTYPAAPLLNTWQGPFAAGPRGGDGRAARRDRPHRGRIPSRRPFANTIAALEGAGRALDRVNTIFEIHAGTLSTPEVQAVEREMAPKLAAFSDQITQNEKLFARIAAVYEKRESSGLTASSSAWSGSTTPTSCAPARSWTRRPRSGSPRSTSASRRCSPNFSQNVLADETDYVLVLDREADLAGLPPIADRRSERRGRDARPQGQVGDPQHPLVDGAVPDLLLRRELREKVWRTFVSRGDNGGQHDNNKHHHRDPDAARERAKLLGYATHATGGSRTRWRRRPSARSSSWKRSGSRPSRACTKRSPTCRSSPGSTRLTIEPWDYRYYAEKVRKAKLRPRRERGQAVPAAREAARGHVLGGRRAPRPSVHARSRDVPVYHPDVASGR
jgi:peptidyl-dipeptidase Dcp